VLRALGLRKPTEDLVRELACVSIDRIEIEPFPETKSILENLCKKNLRLGVVSNAWPSLERKYHEIGLRDFFCVFIISSKLGCYKPDERIFRTAIERIGLKTENLLYIDDSLDYVHKAKQLGLSAVVIARDERPDSTEIPFIDSLEKIEDLLQYEINL
jgi:putative hydrolase of the HAD superfamily